MLADWFLVFLFLLLFGTFLSHSMNSRDSNVEALSDISVQSGENFFCVGGGWLSYMQDQYINHIMNETGATVVLRGRGSGSLENQHGEGNICFIFVFLCLLMKVLFTKRWIYPNHIVNNVAICF